MVTDGADTSDASLDESIASLKARSIPVFTVGVGQERFARDIQVTRVETPRVDAQGHLARRQRRPHADRLCRRHRAAQRRRRRADRRARRTSRCRPTANRRRCASRFTASDAGRADVPVQRAAAGRRTGDAEQRPRRARSRSATGARRSSTSRASRAPRRSSSAARSRTTRTCRSSSCSAPPRTSTCGCDVGSADELVGGFPKTREELFAYRALILGSVEAASFSPDQLRMIADFVSKRGGGLLMLGGRRSFAEGGWAGTPVGEVLPVDVRQRGAGTSATILLRAVASSRRAPARPSPVTQIAADEDGVDETLARHAGGHAPSTRSTASSRAPRCC